MTADTTQSHQQLLTLLQTLASKSLSLWSLPADATCRLINISENATFIVEANDGYQSILRIHRPNYHSHLAIESELAWMNHLGTYGGVVTPATIPGVDGNAIQELDIEGLPDKRFIVMFEFIEGEEPDQNINLAPAFEELGEIAAKTHLHSLSWNKPVDFERLVWNVDAVFGAEPTWGNWRNSPRLTATSEAVMQRLEETITLRLNAFGSGPERYGLIHADMRLANLLVHEGSTRLIDFDDCGFGWYLYDFATGVSFMEDHPQVPALKLAWVKGYRKIRNLSAKEEQEIDTFVMLRRMALCAWIGSHSEVDIAQELSPDFVAVTVKLAEKYLGTYG